jgi:3-deoxy-7-phosphoheptulonate synthase
MLWIGDRTRFDNSAHVEFLKGVKQPHRREMRASLEPDMLLRLLDS